VTGAIINCGLILKKLIYWSLSDFQRNNLYMHVENKIDTTYYISQLCPQHTCIMWLRNQKHRIISLRVITVICKSRITTRSLITDFVASTHYLHTNIHLLLKCFKISLSRFTY
jgi:hypothetical protein